MTIATQLQPDFIVSLLSEMDAGWPDGCQCYCSEDQTTYVLKTGTFTKIGTSVVNDHAGFPDPHTGYQLETEKGQANGYASLDGSGLVPLAQLPGLPPALHATLHEDTGLDEVNVAGLSGLLADSQTPLAHATSHQSGGADAIPLDNLATPDDNTDLNASTSVHGLMQKYPGGTSNFLRADGTFASPGASSTNIKQAEIDFGATPVCEASFLITDADVSATSQLIGTVAYEAPTGKDLDELDMDGLDLKFAPGVGQFTLYARGQDGYVADRFKINYLVG